MTKAGILGAAGILVGGLHEQGATAAETPNGVEAQTSSSFINVKDHGAVGDGVADDTLALETCINSLPTWGGTLYFPAGDYKTVRGLLIKDRWGVTVKGDGPGTSRLIAGANVAGDILKLQNTSIATVKNLAIQPGYGCGAGGGLHVTVTDPLPGQPPTHSCEVVLIQNVRIGKESGNHLGYGLGLACDSAGDLAEVTCLHVITTGCDTGIQAGNGVAANVLDIRLIGCTSSGNNVGVWIKGAGVTFSEGTTLGNTQTDFKIQAAGTCAPIKITGIRSESSKRFLEVYGGAHAALPLVLESIYVMGFSDPNGIVIDYASAAPITMTGCTFRSLDVQRPSKLNIGISATWPCQVVAISCCSDNPNPFDLNDVGQRIVTDLGCVWNNDQGLVIPDATPVKATRAGELRLLSVPARIYDSRNGCEPLNVTKGILVNGQERTIDATVGGLIPKGAKSIVANLVAVETTSTGGFLSCWPASSAWPGTSTMNWDKVGQVIANGCTLLLDDQGQFKAKTAGGNAHLVVDVVGYHQ